jgi:hypothetical protein
MPQIGLFAPNFLADPKGFPLQSPARSEVFPVIEQALRQIRLLRKLSCSLISFLEFASYCGKFCHFSIEAVLKLRFPNSPILYIEMCFVW